jgi:spermidine/putrescine transport system permease protein
MTLIDIISTLFDIISTLFDIISTLIDIISACSREQHVSAIRNAAGCILCERCSSAPPTKPTQVGLSKPFALAAVALWRFRFPFKGLVEGTMSLPIIVPEICLGVAFLIFFAKVDWPTDLPWPLNLSAITIAHITFCFPFVAMVVRARLASFNKEEEEAAKDLGATEWQAFRDVLLPHIRPALVAGALLAFTLSLDDFVITFFTSGPDTITFPVKVYSMVRFSVTPEVNAASTILILLTVILTFIALKLQGVKGIAETH